MTAPASISTLRTQSATATVAGFGAILLWSLLALFTAASGTVPPFQLAAMTFLIGGLCGCASWIVRPSRAQIGRAHV